MKVAERVLDVDSTLTGETGRFEIDAHSIQHIIGILTDLYSDQELAVIREYSTNALDSHREAGNTAPIEVTTPTSLAPFFRVKDYGIGLDAEGLRSIYSKYGSSTKRDTDEQVGMLGLGSKSALTYSDQFTLIGTKNGMQAQVQIGRTEDGGVSYTIVSNEPTDQPNGVEIIVPAKRANEFYMKARELFKFWTPGTVLLNGKPPEHIADTESPTWLIQDELFVFTNGRGYGGMDAGWVVMGNVPYPIPDDSEEFGERYGRKYSVVAFVDIGEVNFTPSREALMLTKLTKGTLARIAADVKRELTNAAQKRVEAAATPSEAIMLAQESAAMGVKTADLKYQGRDVPVNLERSDNGTNLGDLGPSNSWLVMSNVYRSRKNGERYRAIPPYSSRRAIFTGYDSKELSPTKRDKIDQWFSESDHERPAELVFVDTLSADEKFWLTGTPVYDWAPVQEIKLEKSGVVGQGSWRGTRPRGSYEQAHNHGSYIEADQIDTSKPIIYVSTNERYIDLTDQLPSDATVLVMPTNRLEKFLRDFPSAMAWRDYLRKEAKDWLGQQDPAKVEIAKYHISGVGAGLTALDPDRVDDPELEAAIRKQHVKVSSLVQGIQHRSRYLHGFERYELAEKYPNPFKKYPLLLGWNGRMDKNAEHVYLYVNAAYAA